MLLVEMNSIKKSYTGKDKNKNQKFIRNFMMHINRLYAVLNAAYLCKNDP